MKSLNRNLMRTMTVFYGLFGLLASGQAHAEMTNQCQGEMVVVSYSCFSSTIDSMPDVRFYMSEFQTCKDGKITALDRSITGLYIPDSSKPEKSDSIPEEYVHVKYSEQRTTVPGRVDDLTIQLPTTVDMLGMKDLFRLTMTTQMAPDFEGAGDDQWHYVGHYEKYNKKGRVDAEGELQCFVSR